MEAWYLGQLDVESIGMNSRPWCQPGCESDVLYKTRLVAIWLWGFHTTF